MKLLPANYPFKHLLVTVCLLFIFFVPASWAQLQANFTVDKAGGCSPLSVKFTNTTTGASSAVTWQWSFGNANTSAIKDPGATYFTEKVYTVTLTAKDGASTSTKTMDITVYKKPTVDFSVSPAKGCAPLSVTVTANALAGDGSITNYLYDFGDGATVQGTNSSSVHVYSFAQVPPVTVNVTNTYGCYATVTKSSQVEVVPEVKAAFTTSASSLCNVGETVSFTNTSTGGGVLTYLWDFGDGKTSTEQSPVHAYTAKGTYFATLTVTSNYGCAATKKSEAINVANFTADFDVPARICLNQAVAFTNKSTKPFNKAEWWIDNSNYGYSTYDGNLNTNFYSPGEHTVKLVMYYGNCDVSVTKKITVNELPKLDGFIVELQGACGAPVTINFKDTSSDAVAWEWKNNYYGSTFGSTKNAAFTYTSNGYEYVYLTTTNIAGCTSSIAKYVNYDKPNVNIYITSSGNQNTSGCSGLTLGFGANPDTAVKDYQWNFGDGAAVSTDKNPVHVFSKGGSYTVILDYTTTNGCKGKAYYYNITVVDKPVFDFTSRQGTTICGNTPDTLTATPSLSGWTYNWSFNNDYFNYYYGNSTIVKQFNYDTTYSVVMIASNYGCADTVIKKDYIKVLPPFPHIRQVFNTCDGTRGDVRFTEDSKKALKWSWDFGDLGTDNYTALKDTIRHTYNATKAYKVVLSATNGGCTVRDSVTAYVLLKQKPLLASTQTDACGSEIVNFKLSGYESNPYPYNYGYNYGHYLQQTQYGDLSTSNATITIPNNYYYNAWLNEAAGTIQNLDAGKNDLRMISTSSYFGCADTSNFIPVKIHGPNAGFYMQPHSGCFKDPVQFADTSKKSGNSAIVKWEWNFGDGTSQTLTAGGSARHTYSLPGSYYVTLKVTDADGCTNKTNDYLHYVNIGGPKADFYASSYIIPPNTIVSFTNTSAYYNYYYNSSLRWIFSDSTISTEEAPSFLFANDGVFPVTLVTKNLSTGCTDTITKNITVRKVNSAFTYKLSYINNNSCPPVIASFTSVSTNASRLSWNFGDGGVAGDQKSVSHTYNEPGIYRVVHYSYDSNIGVDSTEDFIEVKGPYALLKADRLTGCNFLQVKLTAEVRYASDYTWDFGDGTVVPGKDTFAVHDYLTPGVYVPALILKDAGGCSATSELLEKVIVDSLSASFKLSPAVICDSAYSLFTANANSLSYNALQTPMQYTWIIKHGGASDTLHEVSNSYYFNTVGSHAVTMEVETPYGCRREVTDSVYVKRGVDAGIAGTDKLCKGDITSFAGNASPANMNMQWKWDFKNGNTSALQNPLPQQYSTAGPQQISLVVSNGFCSDTAYHSLMVNSLPVIGFSPSDPFVCKGSSIALTATGGNGYQWSSNAVVTNPANSTIGSSPGKSVFYAVKVTDANGCINKDSVFVKVIDTVKLKVPASVFACQGDAVQLSVSGADKYKWIDNISGISNTNIAGPSVLTNNSGIYTVVGYDNYNCFTDTALIDIRISKLPLVDAGIGGQIVAGSAFILSPVVSGASSWTWSPADYLDCIDCLNPVSKPKLSMLYTLTAYNADGCKASDTVGLQLICAKNLVFIPKAFSPNNDNLNDRFTITGSGIKTIRSITIFSRWGKTVFERKNIPVNDRNNSWDGYSNGEPMAPGAYVYRIQAECDGGDIFDYSGTVMIVR